MNELHVSCKGFVNVSTEVLWLARRRVDYRLVVVWRRASNHLRPEFCIKRTDVGSATLVLNDVTWSTTTTLSGATLTNDFGGLTESIEGFTIGPTESAGNIFL